MKGHKGYALFLILVITALVVITLVLSGVTYFKGRSDANVKLLTAEQQFADVNGDTIFMRFDGDDLSVGEGKLSGTISLLIPETVRSHLIDTNNGKKVFTNCDTGCVLARDGNAQFTLYMTVHDAAGRPTVDFKKSFKLSDFGVNTDAVFFPVTIPVTSFANNYPDDQYKFGIFFGGFDWPSNVYTDNNKEPRTEYEVNGGNVSKSYDITVTRNPTASKSQADRNLLVTFKRSTPTLIYIYVAACIPLILALIFFHLLFFSRHAESKRVEEYMEALIVTVVAVLPLRLVLVPPELTSLTRVDLVLGLGLIAIVAIAGIKYALEVWQGMPEHPETESAEGDLTHAAQPVPVAE